MKYRSKFEANIGKTLPKGTKYESLTLSYNKRTTRKMVCLDCGSSRVLQKGKYLTDFQMPNGIILEVKGHFKPADRTKMESVIKCNPDLDIRMVFMRDNWTTKLKKQKYSGWCRKRGIKYCIGKVPEDWKK